MSQKNGPRDFVNTPRILRISSVSNHSPPPRPGKVRVVEILIVLQLLGFCQVAVLLGRARQIFLYFEYSLVGWGFDLSNGKGIFPEMKKVDLSS